MASPVELDYSPLALDYFVRMMHYLGKSGIWKESEMGCKQSSQCPKWEAFYQKLLRIDPMMPDILARYRGQALEEHWSGVSDEALESASSTKPKKRL